MTTVLHILEAVRGGTSRHLADIVASAPDIDHHVVVPPAAQAAASSGAVVDTASVAAMAGAGAAIHRLDMRRSAVHPANAVAAARLIALRRRVGAGVLHGHSSVGGALARLAGPPSRVPVVYTPNGLATGKGAIGIERLLGRSTDVLIAVSDSEAALARRLYLVPTEQIWVIPNGIDLHPVTPPEVPDLRARLGLDPGVALIGTVARLVDQKAPAEFVAVCAAVIERRPEVHGLLIGMGPLQPIVDAAVERHGLRGHFHQIPHLPRADAVVDQLDVFVLASRFEGGPYTPLEAMRAGVPVVLSDVVGNRDTVEAGRSGILCSFGDTRGMASSVIDLLDDGGRRSAMVAAASIRLRERFDVAKMGQSLTELYCSLAAC